ncbi:MAG: phospholipid carrier-dependent glycosyltransferase [Chloroflexi bacterium]|nr:phospholipid carrier-dependent glycosyltransferase [Chloroflexota bacterium]
MSQLKTSEARLTRYLLLVIIAAFIVLALVYSLTVPLFEGPDEIWHYAFANHLASGGGLPVFDVTQPATFLRNGAHPPLYYALVAAVIAPIDRSDFPAEYRFNLASPRITRGASGTSPNLLIHTAREDFPFRNTALAGHLARLVSIALGTLTVVGIFYVAGRLLHDDRLALIATAFVAFIPQFVYGAALINNDALAAASATWLLYALLRLMDDGRWRWAVLSGVLLGVTLLSKIGMIAVLPIPAVALGLYAQRNPQHRSLKNRIAYFVVRGAAVYGLALLFAGWWYARNFALYGDPLMWREWQMLTGTGRVPPTPIDFLRDMVGFFGLFWADFSLRVDRVLWPIFGMIVITAIIGLVRRAIKRQWPALDWPGLFVALAWLGLLIATAVRYSFNIYDIHGRLLYPALAPIGVMLALGLSGWPKPKWVTGIALAIIMSIAVIAPLAIIQPAYARPIVSALPAEAVTTFVQFGQVELIGYRVKNDRMKAGEPIEVVTYWRRSAAGSSAPTGVVALIAPDGQIVGRAEMLLGTDAYPAEVWQDGEIVVTRFRVPTQTHRPTVAAAQLSVGDQAIDLGRVAVWADRPCDAYADRAADVTFGGSIKLIGYRIEAGAVPRVVLCWQSIKPTPFDYTVFVHVPDGGEVISGDGQPVGGNYPTSVWQAGQVIEDAHPLPAGSELKIPRASIGLYRLDTGERLPVDGTDLTEFELVK